MVNVVGLKVPFTSVIAVPPIVTVSIENETLERAADPLPEQIIVEPICPEAVDKLIFADITKTAPGEVPM